MKLPVLISYAYWDKHMLKVLQEHEDDVDLLIDSGAYTAYTQGKPVLLSEYEEFIQYLQQFLDFNYFVLDVIGDAEASKKNFLSMKERGYEPIPIFTRGSDVKDIKFYYTLDELLGIGGISIPNPNTQGYVKYLMDNHIQGEKVHWLGWSKRDFLFHYKPFGFDSSSIYWGRKFGDIYYMKNNQLLVFTHKQRAQKAKLPRKLKEIMQRIQPDVKQWLNPENWKGSFSIQNICSILAYIQYSVLLNEKLNIKMYLAIADTSMLKVALDTFCTYIKGGDKND